MKERAMTAADRCYRCWWLVQVAARPCDRWVPGLHCHHPARRVLPGWTRLDPIMPGDDVPAWCPGFDGERPEVRHA